MCTHKLIHFYPPHDADAVATARTDDTRGAGTWTRLDDSAAVRVPESLQERTGCHCAQCGAWCVCPSAEGE